MDIRSLVTLAESLKGANLRGYQQSDLEEKLLVLLNSPYKPLGLFMDSSRLWYRGRLCSSRDRYSSLMDCIYPPKENVREFGRANYAGEPVFYAAQNEGTVFGELGAEPGQSIQIITVRLKKGALLPCHIVGDIEHIVHAGASMWHSAELREAVLGIFDAASIEDGQKILYVDSFLAEQFSMRAKRPYEYKLTAAYSKILSAGKGGIIYPSVEQRGTSNLAVASEVFDEHFEVIATTFVDIIGYYGYGVYDFATSRVCCTFEEDGRIIWESDKTLRVRESVRGREVLDEVEGWTVPKPLKG